MRLLFASHTARISGAEWWLIDTLRTLPGRVEPWLATPPGALERLARDLGVPTVRIAGTDGSLRLHPFHTPRAVGEIGLAGCQLRRLARRLRIDIVHANSIRVALSAVAARRLGAPPTVAHVHECLPPGIQSDTAHRIIARADGVLVNSEHTRELFRRVVPDSDPEVLHNGVDLERFDVTRHDRAEARAAFGLDGAKLGLAVIAQITPWKRQAAAIRIIAKLRDRGHPVHDRLFERPGGVRHGLNPLRQRNVRVTPARTCLNWDSLPGWSSLASATMSRWPTRSRDAPLVPLLGEEPFGRVVAAEAMAMGVPVLVTNVGGPREMIEDDRTGWLLPPRRPDVGAGCAHAGARRPGATAPDG